MKSSMGVVWHRPIPDWQQQLEACIQKAAANHNSNTKVFFRADDVAVPGSQLQRLLEIFIRHDTPLSLAVVPAWLTQPRWQAISRLGASRPDLWCWHQHGWRHRNHEPQGKKQEFGPGRSYTALYADLDRGRQRLQTIMGDTLTPIFTPPWNRCSEITLALLQEMGYAAVSRSRGSQPAAPPGLPDHAVDVDLHTDRAPTSASGWKQLMDGLVDSLSRPTCGIMIHHQRMNEAAFGFLDQLLETLHRHRRITAVDMRDLLR